MMAAEISIVSLLFRFLEITGPLNVETEMLGGTSRLGNSFVQLLNKSTMVKVA